MTAEKLQWLPPSVWPLTHHGPWVVHFPTIQRPACAAAADGHVCPALNLSLPFWMAEEERKSLQTGVFKFSSSSSSFITISCLHRCRAMTRAGGASPWTFSWDSCFVTEVSCLQTDALCSAAPMWSSVHNPRLLFLICTEWCTSGSSSFSFLRRHSDARNLHIKPATLTTAAQILFHFQTYFILLFLILQFASMSCRANPHLLVFKPVPGRFLQDHSAERSSFQLKLHPHIWTDVGILTATGWCVLSCEVGFLLINVLMDRYWFLRKEKAKVVTLQIWHGEDVSLDVTFWRTDLATL